MIRDLHKFGIDSLVPANRTIFHFEKNTPVKWGVFGLVIWGRLERPNRFSGEVASVFMRSMVLSRLEPKLGLPNLLIF
jgi:hypothetical protein